MHLFLRHSSVKVIVTLCCLIILDSCSTLKDVTPVQTTSKVISSADLKPYKEWFATATSASASAGSRMGTDESPEALLLWQRAELFAQKNEGQDVLLVPSFQTKGGKFVYQRIMMYKSNNQIDGFRVEYQPEGNQDQGYTGLVTILSINESEQTIYRFNKGTLMPSGGRRIDLPELIVRASRVEQTFQITFSWGGGNFATVDGIDPNNSGGLYSGYSEQDLIQDIINAISDFLLDTFGAGLTPAERSALQGMSLVDLYNYWGSVQTAARMAITLFNRYGVPAWSEPNDGSFNNAYKHALLAFQFAEAFGRVRAQQLLNLHEGGLTACLNQMDNANNTIGLNLYDSGVRGVNDASNALMQMLRDGQLWIIGGGCIIQQAFPR